MPRLEALYVVQFGDVALGGRYRPGGVVVLTGNRAFGGESGYYYVGTYAVDGETLRVDVRIVKHDPTARDAFGDTTASFTVTAELALGDAILQGQMERVDRPGMKLPVRLIRKEDLP